MIAVPAVESLIAGVDFKTMWDDYEAGLWSLAQVNRKDRGATLNQVVGALTSAEQVGNPKFTTTHPDKSSWGAVDYTAMLLLELQRYHLQTAKGLRRCETRSGSTLGRSTRRDSQRSLARNVSRVRRPARLLSGL